MPLSPRARVGRFALQDVVSGGRHRLIFSGELDLATVPTIDTHLQSLWREGVAGIVLDFRRVTFMDSSGLHMTLRVREGCQRQGCEFLLIQGPAPVQRLFEVSGLLDQLPFQAGEAAGVALETSSTSSEHSASSSGRG